MDLRPRRLYTDRPAPTPEERIAALQAELDKLKAELAAKRCANPTCPMPNSKGWVQVAARMYDIKIKDPFTMLPCQIRICSEPCLKHFIREYTDAI